MQKLVEMGFVEAVVRTALEAVNGNEILAIKMLHFDLSKKKMLHFEDCRPVGIGTYRKV